MRLWIRSDLHAASLGELHMLHGDQPAHDVQVLAGDVCYGAKRTIEALDTAADWPVVYVLGNHESYRRVLDLELMQAEDASRRSQHVRFLERSSWIHCGVRFLGATLWTDFLLHGPNRREAAMRYAAAQSRDFDLIMRREANPLSMDPRSHVFQPADAAALFGETVAWLESEFANPHDGPTVVVTHHAPAPGSITAEFQGDLLTPCYVSDLTPQIERWGPSLWVHGHTHKAFDYRVGRTRVICNATGLWGGADAEESGYDPRLVVEI